VTDISKTDAPKPPQSGNDLLRWFLQLYRRGLVFAALIGVIAFTGTGWYIDRVLVGIDQDSSPIQYAGLLFAVGVLTNLAAACIIYLGVREKLIREFQALQNESEQHTLAGMISEQLNNTYQSANDQSRVAMVAAVQQTLDSWKKSGIQEYALIDTPPWDDWIREARTIDICVQGWETWARDHEGAWVEFFSRNGTVNLYLPNPNDERVLTIITERMPPRTSTDQAYEIKNTYRKLKEYRDSARKGTLTHRQLHRMNWYCAVRFDEETLFLSLYEHVRVQEQATSTDSEPRIKSPSYKVPLKEQHWRTYKWIKKEFEGLSLDAYSTVVQHPAQDWD